jgi:outer membrane protein assembly factor BamB
LNVAWQKPLPGEGHASPVIWEDRVFMAACLPDSGERLLICLDRDTGETRWQRTVTSGPLETKHDLNSHASSTPLTDGETLWVSFLEVDGHTIPAPNVSDVRPVTPGQMVVAAYDFAGNCKWLVRPGDFVSAHGYCSNPVLFEDLIIVNGDHDGDSYIVALDKSTGETIWKTPRRHGTRSYGTPLIRSIAGRPQMIVAGSKTVTSFDPRDGSRLWFVAGPTEQFVASPVFNGRFVFVVGGYPTYHVMAIRPDGAGDVTNSHVAWHFQKAACYVPSPVVVGDYLLVADDRGTANCFDAGHGNRLWQTRLGRHFSASLLTAGGLVYFQADDGKTTIVRPGARVEVVAENQLGEYIYSSPAISQGRLFLRGERNLFCIAASP